MARRSAWIEPVSLMAMVPVALWSCPTVTTLSVTASTRGPALAGLAAGLAAKATLSTDLLSLLQPSMGLDNSSDKVTSTLAQPLESSLVFGGSGAKGQARLNCIGSTFQRVATP